MATHGSNPVPEFSHEGRRVVLLTQREATAIQQFLSDYRVAVVDDGEDLGRAQRVIGRQLDWITYQESRA